MTPERWRQIMNIFEAATQRQPEEHDAFLADACGADNELRGEINALLAARREAVGFGSVPLFMPSQYLENGRFIGPYRIEGLLGAGGMGEVYRARDTRLDRDVAIKVLPEAWSADRDRLRRFAQEARATAALNHPRICTIYDVGHEAGTDYLVLEYLEGESLADRLSRGPLQLDEAMRAAIEIADALDKAHRAGIVHRDLKPGNIMVTKSGVKLLDFGLAKLRPSGPALNGRSGTAIATNRLTAHGTILGSFHYMAPEQLNGQEVDARADVWAFGCVLYEMVTGRQAFAADSQVQLISAILRDDPPTISSLHPQMPMALDRIVAACLTKDPDERWQSARDLVTELKWTSRIAEASSTAAHAAGGTRVRWYWLGAAAVLGALMALTGAAITRTTAPVAAPPIIRFQVPVPPILGVGPSLALSPDGSSIAFVAVDSTGVRLLHVRALDSSEVRQFPQVRQPLQIAWSPDSRRIAFTTLDGRQLRALDLAAGTIQTLSEVPALRSGLAWGATGAIVFGSPPGPDSGLYKLEPGSTMSRRIVSGAGVGFLFPTFADEGRLILYLEQHENDRRVCVADLAGQVRGCTRLDTTKIAYSGSGHLMFARDAMVLAQRFDPARVMFVGDPVVVAEQVGVGNNPIDGRHFGVTAGASRTFAYFSSDTQPTSQFAWFDRRGRRIADVGPAAPYPSGFDLSGDARYLVALRGGERESWIIDLTRGVSTRVDEVAAENGDVIWAPDGRRFARAVPSRGEIVEQPAFGGQPRSLVKRDDLPNLGLEDWSSDGRYLAITVLGGIRRRAEAQPVDGSKPIVLVESTGLIDEQHFAPDVKWVVYNSDESGRHEVYVMPFPPTGERWQVSTAGGVSPRWRGDSRELYFLALDGTLMAVRFAPGTPPEIGAPVPLFTTGIAPTYHLDHYAPAPDGRFLLRVPVGSAPSSILNIVVNWTSALPE